MLTTPPYGLLSRFAEAVQAQGVPYSPSADVEGVTEASLTSAVPAFMEKKGVWTRKCSQSHRAEASNVGRGRNFTWGGQAGLGHPPWGSICELREAGAR